MPPRKPSASSKGKPASPVVHPRWNDSVQYVKGVGPRKAAALKELGITTTADLLLNLPRRYIDRSKLVAIADLVPDQNVTVVGRVGMSGLIYGRKKRFEVTITDFNRTGQLTLLWFAGYKYLEGVLKKGAVIAVSGTVTDYHGLQIVHPDFEVLEEWDQEDLTHTGRIIPVYPSGEEWRGARLDPRALRRLIKPLVSEPDAFNDFIAADVREASHQPTLGWALANAHYPESPDAAEQARKRLAFDEFFFLELTLAQRRARIQAAEDGRACDSAGHWPRRVVDSLPWTLTRAQKRVITEITDDMRSPKPMRRLLQGDVGAGKTVVAALAMAFWAETGAQTALLVPTEILAEQHHHTLTRLFASIGVEPVLLTGSLPAAERRVRRAMVESGEARFVVGTHALLSEGVNFHDLGLAVIDEQHRFGVAQRQTLVAKGHRPDLLVMTATPIPRTLALTLYGDLDVSVLDEKPPQKGTIKTVWRKESAREKIYAYIRQAADHGDLTYIVYPLVEESEKSDLKAATAAYDDLKRRFPEQEVGIVHGRIKPKQRQATMQEFYEGRLRILVATTVIEVGVDAPDARLMVIENAERFGLSQLHQLRGRIGRGPGESICVLMTGPNPTPVARERLDAMCATSDGFVIAEEDLRLRGPGEFLGTRQHGLPDFKIAHLVRDAALIEPARKAAFDLLAHDASLRAKEHVLLRNEWTRRYGKRREFLEGG